MGAYDDLALRWPEALARLHATCSEKTWFGFDLDDTLHDFSQALFKATEAVLRAIHRRHAIPFDILRREYSRILQETTSDAFSDGKSSFQYRRERFIRLLEKVSVDIEDTFIQELQEMYERILMASLKPKDGCLGLLKTLQSQGRKIVIITEGPQDAQERTIKKLGIHEHIDALITTNAFGASKVNGLFPRVVQHLGIQPREMVYVGDSKARDMDPATAAGMFCFHFAEEEDVSLESKVPRINRLEQLETIILTRRTTLDEE